MDIRTWILWRFDPDISLLIERKAQEQTPDSIEEQRIRLWIRVSKAPDDVSAEGIADLLDDRRNPWPRVYGEIRQGQPMNQEQVAEIRKQPGIVKALVDIAARYFSDEDDQADAVSEGWVRICLSPAGLLPEDYARIGIKAVRAYYDREYRRRRKALGRPKKSGTSWAERAARQQEAARQQDRAPTDIVRVAGK